MTLRGAALLATMVVAADRLTKMAVMASMHVGETIPVIGGFFSLTYVQNRGAAFGMFANHTLSDYLLIAVAAAAVAGLGWLLVKTPPTHVSERAAAAAIIGGALGNVYDRLTRGAVVDFLDFYIGRWHWPAFNVADTCITLGVTVLVIASFFGEGEGRKASSRDEHADAEEPDAAC